VGTRAVRGNEGYTWEQGQLALASLEKSAALFNSLLQRAFKGELTT